MGYSFGIGYDTWDGSYDNPISDEGVGGFEFLTFRASLEWTPTDNFGALLNAYYSDDQLDDAPMTGQPANCENVGPDDDRHRRYANLCGEVWDLDTTNAFLNAGILGNPNIPPELQFTSGSESTAKIAGARGEDREVTRLSLNLGWDLEPGTITAITGYSRVEHEAITEGTRGPGYAFPFVICENVPGYIDPPDNTVPLCLDFDTPTRFTTGSLIFSPLDTTKEISQELRYTSSQDESIRYSAGGYVFLFERDRHDASVLARSPILPDGVLDPTGPGQPPPGVAFGPFPDIGLAIGDAAFREWFTPTSDLGRVLFDNTKTDSYSIFGTLDWDLTNTLTADFQLRWTLEQKDIKVTSPKLAAVRSVNEDFDFVTGRAGLSYKVTEDWLFYASISNGTKAGGFSVDAVDVIDAETGLSEPRIVIVPFDEEKILSYELGAKGTTAVFVMTWRCTCRTGQTLLFRRFFKMIQSRGIPWNNRKGSIRMPVTRRSGVGRCREISRSLKPCSGALVFHLQTLRWTMPNSKVSPIFRVLHRTATFQAIKFCGCRNGRRMQISDTRMR